MYFVYPCPKCCVLRISLPTKYVSLYFKKVGERKIIHTVNAFNKCHISTTIGSKLSHLLAPPLLLDFVILRIRPSHEVKQP
jgi:hypothetical protein